MMFDTGAVEAVTPETAKVLGLTIEQGGTLRGSGEATIPASDSVISGLQIGEAKIDQVRVSVIPLPRFITDRGDRPPLAGFVGYELLARFVVRLDYDNKTLTLTPASNFHYSGPGERVALSFANKIPVIPATADGIPGRFEIDVGASNALALQGAFADRNNISLRHPSALRLKAGGVDGVFEIAATRLKSFKIAKSEIRRPAAELPLNGRSGVLVAGNDGIVGYQILRQFTITFDYTRSESWFEHSVSFGTRTVEWKTGFQAIKADGPGFQVIHVAPNTPAAEAEIGVGDVITEIDGRAAESLSQPQFGDLMRRSDGTAIHMAILREGQLRRVNLILRELLP
jgi:hypothetical protein